jgi:AcrR family transcriptional regulator
MNANPLAYDAEVPNTEQYVRAPKQERSRRSFDKAVDAAIALLVERGSDSFTLIEVAERAGVSTGSIYTRVASKDDLLRFAHAREMARLAQETEATFGAEPPAGESFSGAVARVIRQLAGLLQGHAPVLGAFMNRASQDPAISETGKALHYRTVEYFCSALLTRREDISHPDADHAVDWSCTVVYSVLARWLGLGTEPTASGEGDWDSILADLTEMVTTYLTSSGPR